MKRLNNLSIYRLLATICILQFHVFFILYNKDVPYETLLSKCVQGLTALSGLLISQKLITDNKKFLLNNVKKILIPALICFAVMATWNLIYMFIFQEWNYISLFFGHRIFNNGLLVQPGNYYYIAYIIVCYAVTPILQRCDKWSALTSGIIIAFELIIGFFFGSSIIAFSYIAGYFIGKKLFSQLTDNKQKFSIRFFFIFLCTTALSLSSYILLTRYSFGDSYGLLHIHSLLLNIASTSFGVSSFLLFIHLFRWTNNLPSLRILFFTDKLTLIIYLFNQAFMCGAMNVAIWVEPIWQKTILVYLFTITFSIAVHYISLLILKPKKKAINLETK